MRASSAIASPVTTHLRPVSPVVTDSMVPATERRQYHPGEENVPLSAAVREAIEAHERTSLRTDEFDLYDHVSPDAIDELFRHTDDVGVVVQFHLTNVVVSVWRDDAIDIRVTDALDERLGR